MTRRNTELLLLFLAAPAVLLLFSMVLINTGIALSFETLAVPLGLFGSFLAAHIAVRFFAKNADPAILPIAFALSGIGITFVTRLAPSLAMRQVMWLFLGVACMVATLALVRNLDKIVKYKYTLITIGVVLLLAPMLPVIGHEELGSRIWLKLGPFSFQPGELAKIFIVLFLSAYLAQNREMLSIFTARVGRFHIPDLRTLAPLLIMWTVSFIIVVFEKDLGSALVCFVLFLIMLYIASGKKMYLIIGFGLAAVGCVFLYMLFGHVQIRVNTWLDPFQDPTGTGYQLCQTIFSLADGGLLGVGIGNGLAQNIPVVESDFIFAAIAEETGLLGGAAVLLLYLSLVIRGFATAARAKSDVSAFVAAGLTTVIVLQAFIIVGGITRLIPLTGITLPFISQGGSSLLASFIAVGLLLRCGDEATGVGTEIIDGTSKMAPIHAGTHSSNASQNQCGVLGRVALGKRLTATAIALSVLFAILVANLTYIMVIKADEYQSYPGNNHTLYKEASTQRGSIMTYDNVILATSIENEDGTYSRTYPAGTMASHITGYYSQQYGLSGIEASMNDSLKGQADFASWTDVVNSFAGNSIPGNDVRLTIMSPIQSAAEQALQGYAGAIVVMDPKTGAVLACASAPTYSNNDVDLLLSGSATSGDDGSGRLINRATQALYAPGSTFKLVTLTSALHQGIIDESTTFKAPASMEIGNGTVTNAGDVDYGTLTVDEALMVSSNTVFAQMAVDLGAESIVNTASSFGFGSSVNKLEVPLTPSLMPDPAEMTVWETAWAGSGQPVGEHASPAGPQATPLQMAMVASAIANDGVMQAPYLVDSVYNAKGERGSQTKSSRLATVMSPDIAHRITEMMTHVVNNGTGHGAALPGVQVAGKTGTAETGKPLDDSWFVGFAPADNPQVVVAIVIEQGVSADSSDESGQASVKAQNVLRVALDTIGS